MYYIHHFEWWIIAQVKSCPVHWRREYHRNMKGATRTLIIVASFAQAITNVLFFRKCEVFLNKLSQLKVLVKNIFFSISIGYISIYGKTSVPLTRSCFTFSVEFYSVDLHCVHMLTEIRHQSVINHTEVYQDQICDTKKQTKAGYDGQKNTACIQLHAHLSARKK